MKKRKVILSAIVISFVLLCTGCGDKMYSSGREGFTSIDTVDGVTFDIVSSISRNATAITNMSSDMAYEADQTYLYKDGESAYFVFNMRSIVCIAQKGTKFHFRDAGNMKDALENNSSVLGVWFDCPKRKAKSIDEEKNGIYKCIIDANAQVSLTPELYSDFSGRLATIETGGEEWSLYVGSIGTEGYEKLDKETKKAISYMVETFTTYEKPLQEATPSPVVAIGGNYDSVSGNEIIEPEENEVQPSESPVPEKTAQPNAQEETDETETEVISVDVEEDALEVTASPFPVSSAEPTVTPQIPTTPSPSPQTRPKTRQYISADNQKKTVHEDNKVYDSDIYSMLAVGKKSSLSLLAQGQEVNGVVKLIEVVKGTEAISIIKNAEKQGLIDYEYFDAPTGCTWQAAHYVLEEGEGYINVKLRGLDGENLRFRGIEYSQRCFDIQISQNEFYSYYAIPNGCPEYALEIGEGTINNSLESGYYHIIQ